MITSIVVTGCYNLNENNNGKIKINDQIISVKKDVPFIRYRFDKYEEEHINYIQKTIEQFDKSTHLLEINLDNNTRSICANIEGKLRVAKYLYITITDDDVPNKDISDEYKQMLNSISDIRFDRYMLRDKSKLLDYRTMLEIIKKLAKAVGISEKDVGVCSSPFSFEGRQCLDAVKARELMSIYNDSSDVALPSANHECMECCGCTRYMIVSGDLKAPLDSGKGSKKSESDDKGEAKKVKKKNTPSRVIPGMYSL